GLQQILPNADLVQCPLADGGEGTLTAFQSAWGGALQWLTVSSVLGSPQPVAFYVGQVINPRIAVLEVAQIVGFTDGGIMAVPVAKRTTLGLGQLMQQLLNQGIRQFYIGLGGSSTNDGGAGLMVGLGVRLLDATGQQLPPTPQGLAQLAQVDGSGLDPRLADCHLTILSDVNSPLCGPQGATHTFGPQKGLTDVAERDRIDRHLARFAVLAEQAFAELGCQNIQGLQTRPGTGAAGGLGFALQLLGGTYTSGAQFIAELLDLPTQLQTVDWVITGEGRSDRQTLRGKVPWVVAQMAQAHRVPATLLSGAIALDDAPLLAQAFQSNVLSLAPGPHCCFPASAAPSSPEDCCTHAFAWLLKAGQQLGYQWLQTHASAP
ncbi:MAG: glycerate kinase, partial [Thermosynechococcaceae cyanobacterium]